MFNKLLRIYGYLLDLAVLLRRLLIAAYRHKAQQKAENFVKQFILGNSLAFSQLIYTHDPRQLYLLKRTRAGKINIINT